MGDETGLVGSIVRIFETPCGKCDGKGWTGDSHDDGRYPCMDCDETGHVLTEIGERVFEAGEHVLAFLRRQADREQVRSGRRDI
jgi:hypothetical protein